MYKAMLFVLLLWILVYLYFVLVFMGNSTIYYYM